MNKRDLNWCVARLESLPYSVLIQPMVSEDTRGRTSYAVSVETEHGSRIYYTKEDVINAFEIKVRKRIKSVQI